MPAALGCLTFEAGDHGEASLSVVLGYKAWRDQFAAQPDAIGANVLIGGRRGRVVGVAPEWFEGLYLGRAIEVWVPLDAAAAAGRPAHVWVVARLRQGSTLEDAQGVAAAAGDGQQGLMVMLHTGVEPEVQARFAQVKDLLEWAAALVFVTAAANVAGFLLSRTTRRAHETA